MYKNKQFVAVILTGIYNGCSIIIIFHKKKVLPTNIMNFPQE